MTDHSFCKAYLATVTKAANAAGIPVPKLRALTVGAPRRHYFVQEESGASGYYIKADCAYDAKALYIGRLIDAAEDKKHGTEGV